MRLKNKTAVITGGTSGIGAASAIRFVEEGARVIIIGRNCEAGESLVEKMGADCCSYIACDICSTEQMDEAMQRIDEMVEEVHILVNCAGIAPAGTIEDLSYEDWDHAFNVNVRSCFAFCKWMVPKMRRIGGGSIVNVASSAGTVGADGLHSYSASKGAVVLLTKAMAADYSKENIRVNCLSPGATCTPMMDCLGEEGLQEFAKLIPAKRMASPREIANVALFLASDEASFMFGSNVLVDGGFTAI